MALSTNPDDIVGELRGLRNEFEGIKGMVNGWTGGAGIDPYFNYLRAIHARFDFNPNSFFLLSSTTVQSIPNATQTAVSFDTLVSLGDPPATWSSAISTAIQVYGRPLEHGYFACGTVSWDTNTSGRRAVVFERNFGGSSIGGNTLVSESASTAIHSHGFVFPWVVKNSTVTGDATTESRLDVEQNSGGALDLIYASLLLTRLY